MAELAALAASIIAVIQLSSKIIAVGYTYLSGAKKSSRYLAELLDELRSFSNVLAILQDYANSNPQSKALRLFRDGETRPLVVCENDLRDIMETLERRDGLRGALGWPLREQETAQLVARIERYKALFMFALGIDQMYLSQSIERYAIEVEACAKAIKTCVEGFGAYAENTSLAIHQLKAESEEQKLSMERIERCLEQANSSFHSLQAELAFSRQRVDGIYAEEKRRKVIYWIYSGSFDEKHLEISSRRQKGTGEWLLESENFVRWKEGRLISRLLWGYGIPGAGKTFLSSVVIDYFQGLAQEPKTDGVAYIYFSYMEQDKQTPLLVLSSVVKQLTLQMPHLPVEIEDLYNRLESQGRRPTGEEMYIAFTATLEAFSRVFLIFDALDECDRVGKRGDLLPLFHRLGKENNTYLFLTSRQYPHDIKASFSGVAQIELSAHEGDIRNYILGQIDKNERARRVVREERCRDRIIDKLIECSQGMFLAVRFHIEHLCQQPTAKKLLIALENLRSSSTEGRPLDPTYDRAMGTLRGQDKTCASLGLMILSWLVAARCPLTVDMVKMAVSVEPGQYELDRRNLPDRATLVDVCAGLVTIDETTNIIRLVHYTVHEYLVEHSTVPDDADLKIALACMSFLSFDVFGEGACESEEALYARRQTYPLLDYAAHSLSFHLRNCKEDSTTDLVLRFLRNPGGISSYFQAFHCQGGIFSRFDAYPRKRLPLHVACIFGHRTVVLILLNNGADVSAVDDHRRTALHLAAFEGNGPIVRLLLGKKADFSARDYRGRTALHMAASRGHSSIVELLLSKGADPLAQDMNKRTALWWAIYGGCEAAVQILLENGGANPPAPTISVAGVAEGQGTRAGPIWRIIQLSLALLGASRYLFGSFPGRRPCKDSPTHNDSLMTYRDTLTPLPESLVSLLHSAVDRGNEGIVRIILDFGADVSGLDEYKRTALSKAVFGGHENMARLLLEKGANPLAHNEAGMTALHMAALSGNSQLARLLLEYGADPSAVDKSGSTPLHVAALRGYEVVVQRLLLMGADVSMQDKDGNDAVFLAARSGHRRLTQILMKAFHSKVTNTPRTRSYSY